MPLLAQTQATTDVHLYLDGTFKVGAAMFFSHSEFDISVNAEVDIDPIPKINLNGELGIDTDEEIGVGFGIHQPDISAFIAGQAILNDEPLGFCEEVVSTSGAQLSIDGYW